MVLQNMTTCVILTVGYTRKIKTKSFAFVYKLKYCIQMPLFYKYGEFRHCLDLLVSESNGIVKKNATGARFDDGRVLPIL